MYKYSTLPSEKNLHSLVDENKCTRFPSKREELTKNKRNPSCRTKLILPHDADIHFDFHHLGHNENNFISDSARLKKLFISSRLLFFFMFLHIFSNVHMHSTYNYSPNLFNSELIFKPNLLVLINCKVIY